MCGSPRRAPLSLCSLLSPLFSFSSPLCSPFPHSCVSVFRSPFLSFHFHSFVLFPYFIFSVFIPRRLLSCCSHFSSSLLLCSPVLSLLLCFSVSVFSCLTSILLFCSLFLFFCFISPSVVMSYSTFSHFFPCLCFCASVPLLVFFIPSVFFVFLYSLFLFSFFFCVCERQDKETLIILPSILRPTILSSFYLFPSSLFISSS